MQISLPPEHNLYFLFALTGTHGVAIFSMPLVLQFWCVSELLGVLRMINPSHFYQVLWVVLVHQSLRFTILPVKIKLRAETLGLRSCSWTFLRGVTQGYRIGVYRIGTFPENPQNY